MQEGYLYEKLPGSNPDKLGVCRVRRNIDGVLYALNYAEVSSVAVDPIEKKPLFHFSPGSQVFSLGTWGCNFHCQDFFTVRTARTGRYLASSLYPRSKAQGRYRPRPLSSLQSASTARASPGPITSPAPGLNTRSMGPNWPRRTIFIPSM